MNHPPFCLQLIFFQSVMHQGSVRVLSQFPQALAGIVLQEPICRLPTTLLGSNTLTHSSFEINSIIFLDLSMVLDPSSAMRLSYSSACSAPHAGIHHTSAYPSESDLAGIGKEYFHRQAPALLYLEAQNTASFVFCRKTSLQGDAGKMCEDVLCLLL